MGTGLIAPIPINYIASVLLLSCFIKDAEALLFISAFPRQHTLLHCSSNPYSILGADTS